MSIIIIHNGDIVVDSVSVFSFADIWDLSSAESSE